MDEPVSLSFLHLYERWWFERPDIFMDPNDFRARLLRLEESVQINLKCVGMESYLGEEFTVPRMVLKEIQLCITSVRELVNECESGDVAMSEAMSEMYRLTALCWFYNCSSLRITAVHNPKHVVGDERWAEVFSLERKTQQSRSATKGHQKRTQEPKEFAQRQAQKRWLEDPSLTKAECAQKVDLDLKTENKRWIYAPTTIEEWIKPKMPEEKRKGGAPRKKRNRNPLL